MALIDEVRQALQVLADEGWRELFAAHGLNIDAVDLETELARSLAINRNLPGFEDFALEGIRGVTPGQPAQSLLYHALASPNVVSQPNGGALGVFPTLKMIETVENYVFATAGRDLLSLQTEAGHEASQLAIAVFAYEYRPGVDTPHRRHADLCFSRTGVSRVGTREANYSGSLRGFLPLVEGEPFAIAAVPARYSAWLTIARPGLVSADRPMRARSSDAARRFWIPVHKLFDGQECLNGFDLDLTFQSFHVNEKLKRIHENFDRLTSSPDGSSPVPAAELEQPPYRFTDGIAELSSDPDHGAALLLPEAHAALVEPARDAAGNLVGFPVPQGVRTFVGGSTITLPPLSSDVPGSDSQSSPRLAPEYIHARTELLPNGETRDLNQVADVATEVGNRSYQALHYVDYTGDGWVDVQIPALAFHFPTRLAAYSLVTAPDFFPRVEQRELVEWGERIDDAIGEPGVWRIPPAPLNEGRTPANLQLPGDKFDANDGTVTAVIAFETGVPRSQASLTSLGATRSPCLPDAAGNVFEPGWDVSIGFIQRDGQIVEHLAAYGLGSPFPEDAKLCSALSAFWPGASPDTSRTFAPQFSWPTVTPLTDDEIGRGGGRSWDGIDGPGEVMINGAPHVDFPSFDHADYTVSAAENRFSMEEIRSFGRGEYLNRTAVMLLAYRALGLLNESHQRRAQERVNSFRRVSANDPEVTSATAQAGTNMGEPVFRLELVPAAPVEAHPNDPRRRIMRINRRTTLFVGNGPVILRENNGPWVNTEALVG